MQIDFNNYPINIRDTEYNSIEGSSMWFACLIWRYENEGRVEVMEMEMLAFYEMGNKGA